MKNLCLFFIVTLLFLGKAHGQEVKEQTDALARILDGFVDHFVVYEIQPDDTLAKIARELGTTVEFIKRINRLDGDQIRAGQQLTVWQAPFTIEIDKSRNLLYLNLDGTTIKEYHVSTGKAAAVTPVGEFTIQSRYPNPTWYHKGNIVPGGSAENWLGTRWLGFDKPKYGIHGTIYPELIGQSVSGGCVRMKNHDVEELYEYIPIGTKVLIKDGDKE